MGDVTMRRHAVPTGLELSVRDFVASKPVDGPSFVLVHGLASNARMWDGVGRRLAAAGHRAVAVDLRGHGQSDKPDGPYDTPTVANDVHALIEHLGLEGAIAVGQSWGGNVVIELAHLHGGAVRGVACVDGGFIDLRSTFPEWDDCLEALAPPKLIGTEAKLVEAGIRTVHSDWPEEGIAGAMANFEVRPDGTIAPWLTFDRHIQVLRGLWEHDPQHRFQTLTTPVLWMPADSGQVAWTTSKRAALAEAEQLLARSRTVWFSPAHHDVHAQQPEAVTSALLDAMNDNFFS